MLVRLFYRKVNWSDGNSHSSLCDTPFPKLLPSCYSVDRSVRHSEQLWYNILLRDLSGPLEYAHFISFHLISDSFVRSELSFCPTM